MSIMENIYCMKGGEILDKWKLLILTILLSAAIAGVSISTSYFLNRSSPLDRAIDKTFVYEASGNEVEGLYVELYDGADLVPIQFATTDATGTVLFDGLDLGTYRLEWTWAGVLRQETVIVDSSALIFELTNVVPSKSERGNIFG